MKMNVWNTSPLVNIIGEVPAKLGCRQCVVRRFKFRKTATGRGRSSAVLIENQHEKFNTLHDEPKLKVTTMAAVGSPRIGIVAGYHHDVW